MKTPVEASREAVLNSVRDALRASGFGRTDPKALES